MKTFSFKPDRKLILKNYLIIFTVTILIFLIAVVLQIAIPLGGKTTSSEVSDVLWPIILIVVCAFWILALPLTFLWVKNLSYDIEADRISIHKGILTKIQQNIPYRAITDFMLHRSLYDRILGLGSIRVQTAGQTQTPTGYEGNIAGLLNWDELLNELRQRVKYFYGNSEDQDMQNEQEILSSKKILQEILNELRILNNKIESQR